MARRSRWLLSVKTETVGLLLLSCNCRIMLNDSSKFSVKSTGSRRGQHACHTLISQEIQQPGIFMRQPGETAR